MITNSLIVVARIRSGRFISMEDVRSARGVHMDEVWIFGAPMDDRAWELWHLVQPFISLMDPKLVHRVEVTPFAPIACGYRADILFTEEFSDAQWRAALPQSGNSE